VSTVIAPIKDLVTRLAPMALLILILIAGFRRPGYISNAMAVPLFKSLHYSDTDIATVTKLFGFWVGLGGTFFASFVMPRLGMMASLLIGTVAGSASHLALAWLAAHGNHEGNDFWTFAIAVGIAYAFASIVLITYMSSLTTTQLAASQFALLTSICALPGSLVAGVSGYFVQWLGFERFFIATSLIGAPVAALCWWIWRRQARTREDATDRREVAAE
jgi:MFS transporter, PAT family, beta-lactamase induction signal transducer AmpG